MMTLTPSTVRAPSSTRLPLGSVIVTEFPTSKRATCVVIVTALGGDESEEPLIGEELTRELADAGEMTRNERMAIAPTATALRTVRFLSQVRRKFASIVSLLYTSHYRYLPLRIGRRMPTYQYACNACHREFEVFQAFSDSSLTHCPECNGEVRKVYSAVGVVFKGSGFYKTDSKSASQSSSPAAPKELTAPKPVPEIASPPKTENKTESKSKSESQSEK